MYHALRYNSKQYTVTNGSTAFDTVGEAAQALLRKGRAQDRDAGQSIILNSSAMMPFHEAGVSLRQARRGEAGRIQSRGRNRGQAPFVHACTMLEEGATTSSTLDQEEEKEPWRRRTSENSGRIVCHGLQSRFQARVPRYRGGREEERDEKQTQRKRERERGRGSETPLQLLFLVFSGNVKVLSLFQCFC